MLDTSKANARSPSQYDSIIYFPCHFEPTYFDRPVKNLVYALLYALNKRKRKYLLDPSKEGQDGHSQGDTLNIVLCHFEPTCLTDP